MIVAEFANTAIENKGITKSAATIMAVTSLEDVR
jgi:hypothetical protein